jgi:hypothetical protein
VCDRESVSVCVCVCVCVCVGVCVCVCGWLRGGRCGNASVVAVRM